MAFMGAMRDSAKWVMLILSLAFVGWLVLDWVQSRTGLGGSDPNPVVGVVSGRDIRLAEWNFYLQNRTQAARSQSAEPLTEEEARNVREAAWDQLVNDILIQQELRRAGIRVHDEEIRQAFRTSPPPEFLTHPAFQTDGRFDPVKYEQYFSSPTVDENLLLQIEAYYREQLPRLKLERQMAAGVYVTDEEAWEWYRDHNASSVVRFVSLDPRTLVPDSAIRLGEDEVRDYYRDHRDEYTRPATARVVLVSIVSGASAADSAAARSRVDSLRQVIVSGEISFEDAALRTSADSASGSRGGDLGRVRRGDLVAPVEEAAFSLPIGRVSEPIVSPFGLHLLRVDNRWSDSVALRHILVPIRISGATEDSLFDLIDALEEEALTSGLGSAAEKLGLPVRRDVVLARGSTFVPGAGSLGVAVDWAFDPQTAPGDLSPFFENANGFHAVELVDRQEEGTFPLAEVEAQIREVLAREKKRERAREILREVRAEMETEGLIPAAERRGWSVERQGPFTRVDLVPGLGQRTEAIGAAFGLPIGSVSDVLDAGDRLAILAVLDRTPADREAFEEQKEALKQTLTLQLRQQYVQTWITSLRAEADVRDLRDRLSAAAPAQS